MTKDGPGQPLRLRILLSYWYYSRLNLVETSKGQFGDPEPEFFADSGAYSAMTQGGEVNIEEYAIWLQMWSSRLTAYANLDVIGNAERTAANQKYLEGEGLSPLPVFHGGSDFAELERYCEAYPYVAIGGVVGRAKNPMAWLVRCHQIARKHGTVLHGFGITSWSLLKAFPWYSVDSSSWASGFRFGIVPLFDERRGSWITVTLRDKTTPFKCGDLLRRYGVEPDTIANLPKKAPDRTLVAGLAALSYIKAEAWLRKYHGPVQLADSEEGAKVHLAVGGAAPKDYFGAIQKGLKIFMADASKNMIDLVRVKDFTTGLKIHLVDSSSDNLKRANDFVQTAQAGPCCG